MCDPISLAVGTFVVGAASSVVSYQQQSYAAEQQNQYYEINRRNAENAAADEDLQLQLRQRQEEEKAGAERFDNALETRAKARHAEAAAGEAGVTGLSVDGLIADIYNSGGRSADRIATNEQMSLQQLNLERQGVRTRMSDRINSARRGTAPSGLALGLNIANAGLSSAGGYRRMTR